MWEIVRKNILDKWFENPGISWRTDEKPVVGVGVGQYPDYFLKGGWGWLNTVQSEKAWFGVKPVPPLSVVCKMQQTTFDSMVMIYLMAASG